jgi:hypothetical protein
MVLVLALTATAALTALSTSTAGAVEEETLSAYFTTNGAYEEPVKIDGSQVGTNTFGLGGKTVTCASATFSGSTVTQEVQSEQIELTPKYEKCHVVFLGLTKTATITVNECSYLFTATTTKTESEAIDYPVDFTSIKCPTGKQIEVHIYEGVENEEKTLCTYDIKAQGPLSEINATNKANTPSTANDVVADLNVSSISVSNTKPSAFCGSKESETATYKGEITLQATTEAGASLDLSVAAAAPKVFNFAGKKPSVLTGEKGSAELITEKGPIKCTEVHYEGTVATEEAAEVTIKPSYSNCTAFGLTTIVYFEGCEFIQTLVPKTTVTGKPTETHTTGPMHIECPEGTTITFTPTEGGKAICTISVLPVGPGGTVDTKNINPNKANFDERYVRFTNTVEKVVYEVEGKPETCGENEVGFLNGELKGEVNVLAYKDEGGGPPPTKGAQRGYLVTGS